MSNRPERTANRRPIRVNRSRQDVVDLVHKDRALGAVESSLAGDCESPFEQQHFGYPDPFRVGRGVEPDRPVVQTFFLRCRRCQPCLDYRRRLWTARAIAECQVSSRTWFGTLTLSPDWATWARMSALAWLEHRQSDVTDGAVFAGMVKVSSPEVTKFLDRVRKVSRFRYLLVTEAHKTGIPHWHLLLHEEGKPLPKRMLEHQWRLGFSHWRLVDHRDPRAAGYVCKYLSKTLSTKPRGSQGYGSPDLTSFTERILEATRVLGNAVKKPDSAPVAEHQPDGEAPQRQSQD